MDSKQLSTNWVRAFRHTDDHAGGRRRKPNSCLVGRAFHNESPVIEFLWLTGTGTVPVSHKFSLNDSFLMELLLVFVRFGNACLMARV
jgi:hypothetical protein